MTIAAPVFTYPGSKSNLASWIIGQMPKHTRYVEPFAGTLAVLLAKSRVPEEVVNDLDDNLVNFFRVLRDHPDELIRRCELTPYARSEFEYSRDLIQVWPELESDGIERARLFWVYTAFSLSGTGSGFRGVTAAHQIENFRQRMASVSRRLCRVTFESESAVSVIERYDGPEALFYCDPPYVGETRAENIYRVDMTEDRLHRDFARCVSKVKGRVIISGYPHPLYDDELFTLDRGWHRISVDVSAVMGHVLDGTSKDATEVLWANFPMRSQLDLFS